MIKKILLFLVIALLILIAFRYFIFSKNEVPADGLPQSAEQEEIIPELDQNQFPDKTVLVENLTIPWDLAFLPDNSILITERPGRLVNYNLETGKSFIMTVPGVEHTGEAGLLGLTLHPNFEENKFIYIYITDRDGSNLVNRIERYRFENNLLSNKLIIVSDIPGAQYHDGGRIDFGPDGYLYIATGDAGNTNLAQDKNSLAGKILRVKDNGEVPRDNPFGNAVWSYGHRNPQGFSWDDEGRMWATEHGRSGVTSGLDEINLIEVGNNYGWPDSQGDEVLSGTIGPVIHSSASKTWAPASALYWDGSLFFGGLRGEALYEAILSDDKVLELKEHFKGEFGRIRSVRIGNDGMFYITTSNRDGRGEVGEGDDKIIRLNPNQFR